MSDKLRILFLSRWFPYQPDNGSKLRIYHLLRGLGAYHDVTLLSFADQPDVRPDAPEIQAICSEVQIVPWHEFNPNSARAWVGFLSFKPRFIFDTFSVEMAGKITQLVRERKYDLIIASQLSMAVYHPYFGNVPAIFEEVELGLSFGGTQQSSNLIKHLRSAVTRIKLRMYLSRLLSSFQACSVVSEQEHRLLLRNFSGCKSSIEVIPNCVQVNEGERPQSNLAPNQLIFSGSFRYYANYEAMLWFVREVFPMVLRRVPDAHLIVTGDRAGLSFPPTPNVTLAGHVDDIKTLVASSWISLAPMLSGGGTRLKILEAMAVGTPVVATSKGAEGLNAVPGEHILVADAPNAFANQVIRLLESKDLRDKLSFNGKHFVEENYNWELVFPRFLHLVENTVEQRIN